MVRLRLCDVHTSAADSISRADYCQQHRAAPRTLDAGRLSGGVLHPSHIFLLAVSLGTYVSKREQTGCVGNGCCLHGGRGKRFLSIAASLQTFGSLVLGLLKFAIGVALKVSQRLSQ